MLRLWKYYCQTKFEKSIEDPNVRENIENQKTFIN